MEASQLIWAGSSVFLHGGRVTVHNSKTLLGEGEVPAGQTAVASVSPSGAQEVALIKEDGSVSVFSTSDPKAGAIRSSSLPVGPSRRVTWAVCTVLGPKSLPGLAKLLAAQQDKTSAPHPHKSGDPAVLCCVQDDEAKLSSIELYNTRTETTTSLWSGLMDHFVVSHIAASLPDPHTIAVAGTSPGGKSAVQVVLLQQNTAQRGKHTDGSPEAGFCRHVSCQNPTTALSVHPFRSQVSVGDVQGRIRTWLLPEGSMKEVHWHSHDVKALVWSPDGTVLLSGGEEAVLCLWNARSWESNKIPRLGGAIVGGVWSPDSAQVCIAMSPSQLTVVDIIQKKPVRVVHGAPVLKGQPCESMHPVPTTSAECVAMFGRGVDNCVRVFDPTARIYVKTLRTSAANATSRVDSSPLPTVAVTHLDFSAKGDHLATLEVSDVTTFQQKRETVLRFWHAEHDALLDFSVNTYVTNPHAGTGEGGAIGGAVAAGVTAVAMSKVRNDCYTLSRDGCVKKWSFSPSAVQWRHADTAEITCGEALAMQVSADGSVLGVCVDASVVLLRASDLQELRRLPQHLSRQALCEILFFASDPAAKTQTLVAARSPTHLLAWEVASGALLYTVALPAVSLAAVDGGFVAATGEGVLLHFQGSDAVPVATHALEAQVSSILIPRSRAGRVGQVVLYVGHGAMHRAESQAVSAFLKAGRSDDAGAAAGVVSEPEAAKPAGLAGGLAGMFAARAPGAAKGVKSVHAYQRPAASCKTLERVYQGDTHSMLPPASALGTTLDALLTFNS